MKKEAEMLAINMEQRYSLKRKKRHAKAVFYYISVGPLFGCFILMLPCQRWLSHVFHPQYQMTKQFTYTAIYIFSTTILNSYHCDC
jgi:hypothetical protein